MCEDYKKLIYDIESPLDILKKLKDLKYPKILFGSVRVWNNINFAKSNETAIEFISRFDKTLKQVEVHGVKIMENEIIRNFVMAVDSSYPEISCKFDAALKMILLNEEAKGGETKERCNEGISAQNAAVVSSGRSRMFRRRGMQGRGFAQNRSVCFRCGKRNHTANECWSEAIICYNCKQLTTDHKSSNYPRNTVSSRNRVGRSTRRNPKVTDLYVVVEALRTHI